MKFLLLGILIALSAFFAAGELAVLRIRPSRVEKLLDEKKTGANSIQKLQKKLRLFFEINSYG